MGKYFRLLQLYFSTELEYRAELVTMILKEFIIMGGGVVLWYTIYQSTTSISGYGQNDIILYYLLVPLIGFFTWVELSDKLGPEVKDGILSTQLIKPYRIWIACLMRCLSEKATFLSFIFPLYTFILVGYFYFHPHQSPTLMNTTLASIMIVSAFFLHVFLDLAVSWIAFWVDDVWSFKFFKEIAILLLGGVSFPLEFLPEHLKNILYWLPFKFFYYIPISYLLGKSNIEHLIADIGLLAVWTGIIFSIGLLLWYRGLVKYEAYGH